jgi:hypothetical protein
LTRHFLQVGCANAGRLVVAIQAQTAFPRSYVMGCSSVVVVNPWGIRRLGPPRIQDHHGFGPKNDTAKLTRNRAKTIWC